MNKNNNKTNNQHARPLGSNEPFSLFFFFFWGLFKKNHQHQSTKQIYNFTETKQHNKPLGSPKAAYTYHSQKAESLRLLIKSASHPITTNRNINQHSSNYNFTETKRHSITTTSKLTKLIKTIMNKLINNKTNENNNQTVNE